ncbi:MAG: SGNH/GDSL hydrolase family protein [Micropruina sp.]
MNSLTSTPNPPWTSYVAIGDSITEGLADALPDGRMRGWADRLAQHLADRRGEPVRYANLAIRGRLLGQIIDEQLEPALALRPDLVSLWGGGNDMLRPGADPDALATKLEEAVARLRGEGIDVLLGIQVDCKDSPIIRLTRPASATFNANVWSLARRQGAHVMDVWSMRSLRDWRMWHEDRLHLNQAGHERVSQAALVGLGLAPDRLEWDAPLLAQAPMTRRQRAAWNYAWAREHAGPWIGRRVRRTSTGAGRTAKYPAYIDISPGAGADNAGPGRAE